MKPATPRTSSTATVTARLPLPITVDSEALWFGALTFEAIIGSSPTNGEMTIRLPSWPFGKVSERALRPRFRRPGDLPHIVRGDRKAKGKRSVRHNDRYRLISIRALGMALQPASCKKRRQRPKNNRDRQDRD